MFPHQGFDDEELTLNMSTTNVCRDNGPVPIPIPIPSRAAPNPVGAAAAVAEIADTGANRPAAATAAPTAPMINTAAANSGTPVPEAVVTAPTPTAETSAETQQQPHQQQRQPADHENDEQRRRSGSTASAGHSRERIKTGQRIEAYRVLRTLGEGSFGKVKLAVHSGTNQQVALKIIAHKRIISRDMAGRVEREIEYLQLLRHPHIIKL
jgi:hypothetical protein